MLVSGTMGNSSFVKQDIQNSVANPTQIVASVSSNTTTKDGSVAKQSVGSSKQNQKINNNIGVEDAVREYFADIPLMVEISKCESRYRQFEPNGDIFRGKINANDVGALQINETYHLKRAQKLGYDVHSLQGNMAYARLLYEEQGPQPWSSSYPCWGKSPLAANFKPKSRTVIVTTSPRVETAVISNADDAATSTPVKVAPEISAALNTTSAPVSGETSVLAER